MFSGLAFSWGTATRKIPADPGLCVSGGAAFLASRAGVGQPKLVRCRDNGAVDDNKAGRTLARVPIRAVLPEIVLSAKKTVLLGGGAIGGELACLFIYA